VAENKQQAANQYFMEQYVKETEQAQRSRRAWLRRCSRSYMKYPGKTRVCSRQRIIILNRKPAMKTLLRKRNAAFVVLCLLLSGLLPGGCGRGKEPADKAVQAAAGHDDVDNVDDVIGERQDKDAFFKSDSSPLLAGERGKFRGLDYYPVNPELRFQVRLQRHSSPKTIRMATNTGEIRSGIVYGFFEFTIEDRICRVQVYRLEESFSRPALFIPFLDATSGDETYEGGRYIDLTENTSGMYDLDFNRAYNPYCAYNPEYSCPAPPEENALAAPVRAGEKKYQGLASAD
jgi:uncharacterized protein (DUF1684 family)